MKFKKYSDSNLENIIETEEIFIGETDEEVLNCEGGPCNFIIKHENE